MSIGQIFANVFGSNAAIAQPAPQVQNPAPQPGNFPAQPTPGMATDPANPAVPVAGNPAPAPAAPEGFDKFNDLWKPAESPANATPEPLFNVKPEQLMEVARKVDFTKVMNPEQLQAVAQGGQGAVQAMQQIMNTVAQTVYAQNMHATTKMVEQAVQKTQEQMLAQLPQQIKLQNVSESIRGDNPAFNHPAAAPIMGALQQQLTVKYPNATAAEIASMARDYMSGFAQTLQPKPTQSQLDSQSSGNFDWDKWAQ